MPSNYSTSSDNSYVGVVLPSNGLDPVKVAMYYQQQNEEKKKEQLQLQRQDKAHQEALQKYFGSYFDPKDYHTGIINYDKNINDKIAQGRDELQKYLIDNPTASMSDAAMIRDKVLNPVIKLHTVGKSLFTSMKAQAEAYKDDKGIDNRSLYIGGLHNALYKKDPSGKVVEKSPDEVDPDKDYMREFLDNNQEQYVKGSFDVNRGIAELNKSNINTKVSTGFYTKNGTKIIKDFNVTLNPQYQEIERDSAGNVLSDKDGSPKIRFKSNPLRDANGKVILERVPDEVYNTLANTQGEKAQLQVATKKYLRDTVKMPEDQIPAYSSKEFEDLSKNYLYSILPKEPKVEQVKNDQRLTATIVNNMAGLGGSKDNNSSSSINSEIRDIYKEVDTKASLARKGSGYPLIGLSASAQKTILKYTNDIAGKTEDDKPYTQGDIYIRKESNGLINIVRASDNRVIAPIDFEDVNIPNQPGVKEKRTVIQKAKDFIKGTPKKKDPLGIL